MLSPVHPWLGNAEPSRAAAVGLICAVRGGFVPSSRDGVAGGAHVLLLAPSGPAAGEDERGAQQAALRHRGPAAERVQ